MKRLLLLLWLLSSTVHAAPPGTIDLLPGGLRELQLAGAPAGTVGMAEVPVSGQTFPAALRVDVPAAPGGKNDAVLVAHITRPMKKNDVLWLSFKARRLDSTRETGEAFFEIRLERLVNGKFTWPSHIERGVSIGADWTDTSIPFVLEQDVTPADTRLVIQLDKYAQRFELGPVTLKNYGPDVALSSLPRSVVRYAGDTPDADWRAQAQQRIQRLRMGELSVQVSDQRGHPLRGAQVSVRMRRNAFNWGTAVTSEHILNQNRLDSAQYRAMLTRYFNQVVFENEAKAKYWAPRDPAVRDASILKASAWLHQQGLSVRGHVMVWPSFWQSPHLAKLKGDPQALRQAVLANIRDQSATLAPAFDEWDVLNEPSLHREFTDILGRDEMNTWFKAARAGAPGVKLFLNDFTMFHGQGPGSASERFFSIAQYLKQRGAPVDAIGEQAHIGGTPPGIPYVLERLDHFATLGLPIQISEFDINSNDDDFKARYLGDFMTAIYSHPATVGFVQWGFWEGQHWFPVAALWNKDWTLRKHGQVYADLVRKTWWTDFDGATGADGQAGVRGYIGEYDVTVSYQGRQSVQRYTLTREGGKLEVRL